MGFLLGLFIGCSIFILGFLVGGGCGLYIANKSVNDDDDSVSYPDTGQLKLILPDFGDFIDSAVDCYEKNVPMLIQSNNLDVILMDAEMHLEQAFNIDNEG